MPKKTKQPHNFHKKLQEHLDERIDTPYGQRPLSYGEIAEKLGISANIVRKHNNLSKGEKNLRLKEIMRIRTLSRRNKNYSPEVIDLIKDLLSREIGYDYHRMENSRRYTIAEIRRILKENYGIEISGTGLHSLIIKNKLTDMENIKHNFRRSKTINTLIPTHQEKALVLNIIQNEKLPSRKVVELIDTKMKEEFLRKQKRNSKEYIEQRLEKYKERRYNYFLSLGFSPEDTTKLLKTNLFTNITEQYITKQYLKLGIKRFKPREKINAFNDEEKKRILNNYKRAIYRVIFRYTDYKTRSILESRFNDLWIDLFDALDYYDSSRGKLLSFIIANSKYILLRKLKEERHKMASYERSIDENSRTYSKKITKKTSSGSFIYKIDFGDIDRIYEKVSQSKAFTAAEKETLKIIKYMLEHNFEKFRLKDYQSVFEKEGISLSTQAISLRLGTLRSKLVKYKYI